MKKFLSVLVLPAALLFFSCSSINSSNPAGAQNGTVNLNIHTGKIGMLAKKTSTSAVELKTMYIALSKNSQIRTLDTVSLTGTDETVVLKSYPDLQAGSDWSINVKTCDINNRIIHNQTDTFEISAGKTTELTVDMPANYSSLQANFNSIPNNVKKCDLIIDSITEAFQESPLQDTVRLSDDYVTASPSGEIHHISLNAYDQSDALLYAAESTITVFSGRNQSYQFNLKWVNQNEPPKGAAEISVSMGASGLVIINGDFEKFNPPQAESSPFTKDTNTIALFDFNGNGNDCIGPRIGLVNNANFSESPFGEAIRFFRSNGSSKTGCFVKHDTALMTSNITMEALVYTDSLLSGYNHIIDKSWSYGLTIYDGIITAHFNDAGTKWFSNVSFPLHQWVYLCVTLNGTEAKLYVNGSFADSSDYYKGSVISTYDLGIGNASVDTHDVPFLGKIDAIRISKVARSAEEINDTWNIISKNL